LPWPAFESLGLVTTTVYEAGCLEITSGPVSRTWYDPSAPPAAGGAFSSVTTYVYDPAAGTAGPEGQDEVPG
jgi:hypothetical protein